MTFWDDLVLLQIVDLLGELLAYDFRDSSDVHSVLSEGGLAGFERVWLAKLVRIMDGRIGELCEGGCEPGQHFGELAVDFIECVDVGGSDLAVRLGFRWFLAIFFVFCRGDMLW